jgi:hypothetical protein
VADLGPEEIVWRLPLAMAGHLVAQAAAGAGIKIKRPDDEEAVAAALREINAR